MVNLSTDPAEILNIMLEELPIAWHYFKKAHGGKQRCLKLEDQMMDKALEDKEAQFTEVESYITKTGNRWLTYIHTEYYPKALYTQTFHFSFIYYETYASCGAFFPLYPPTKKAKSKPDGVLIFTAHFFQRMAERTGKLYRSKELIKEFISTKSTQSAQVDEDGDVIVKFKGGYGFGVQKSSSPRVFEIRTYLSDEQLSPGQKRKCEKVDALATLTAGGMWMKQVAKNATILQNFDEEAIKEGAEKLEALKKLGLEKHTTLALYLHMSFIGLLQEIFNTKIDAKQSALIVSVTFDNSIDIIKRYVDFNSSTATKEENEAFDKDFIAFAVKCAKQLKLKSVNEETIQSAINKLRQKKHV